eukprot:jgi/Psemu1/1871/gm1.1871_g
MSKDDPSVQQKEDSSQKKIFLFPLMAIKRWVRRSISKDNSSAEGLSGNSFFPIDANQKVGIDNSRDLRDDNDNPRDDDDNLRDDDDNFARP